VEWYDFFIYAYTSIYFAALFFPQGDQTTQLLATAGIFAVGFFMRPLGGWIFGYLDGTGAVEENTGLRPGAHYSNARS